jgi:hypothetical protein
VSIEKLTTDAALGGGILGGVLGSSSSSISTTPDGEVVGNYRSMLGWGFFGARVYSKGYFWTPLTASGVGGGGFASITLTTSSGSVLGQIRTDIQNTILKEIRFTIDEKGCAEFSMKLNKLPDFKITPIARMVVNVGNTSFNWYTGDIELSPEQGTFRDEYVYKGYGLRKQLTRVSVEETYTAPQDIGLIVEDIVQNYVSLQTTIGYNAAKIQTTTGVLIASDIELNSGGVDKILDSLSEMSNARWGVDGEGEFYFELKDDTIIKNWYVGYDVLAFNPDLNTNNVKNSIFVQRQSGVGSGGVGWAVASIKNDATSQAKFRVKELNYQMPGYFSDADCDVVGDALLAELKDPKYYAKAKDIYVDDEGDYIARGVHRFVNTPTRFDTEVQDCEDYTDWAVATGGDLVLSNVNDILISGAYSMKAVWTAATGASFEAPIDVTGAIKKVKFSIRANRSGQFMTVGVGDGSFLQNQRSISINVTEEWIPFEWDVSSLNLSTLDEVGFVIDNSDSATTVWIDNIEIEMVGSKHYSMELTRASYVFSPNKQAIESAEFGPAPERMYDYVSNLMSQAEENKFAGEQR